MPPDIACVVFDCDGVLVNSETLALESELQLLDDIGYRIDESEYRTRLAGLSGEEHERALRQMCADKTGAPLPIGFEARLRTARWTRYETELKPLPGVQRFLSAFDGEVAVASSSDQRSLTSKLRLAGLLGFFADRTFSADMVRRGKPSPELYRLVSERLRTPKEHCIVLEDSSNGIISAAAAGFEVWALSPRDFRAKENRNGLRRAGAQRVVTSFDEFKAAVKRRGGRFTKT